MREHRVVALVAILLLVVAVGCKKPAPQVDARWQGLGMPLFADHFRGTAGPQELRAEYVGMAPNGMFADYRDVLIKAGYAETNYEATPETWTADFTKGSDKLHVFVGNGANDDDGSTVTIKDAK